MMQTEFKRILITLVIVAVVLALVYINVATPDNVAYIDEVTTITNSGGVTK
ncbi:hypothetical protein [Mammaliicoccus sp. JADD-157]|uniref:hypothetical protein n=1 Tax=Mammaliicoccus sp. JADD-157 TaxID=3404818 RepID=UPI003BB5D0CC